MITEKELIDFCRFLKDRDVIKGTLFKLYAKQYMSRKKSINSTCRSERRADGSNSKAKEVCPRTGLCDIYEQWGFCPYQCALFNRGQTD